MINFKSIPFFKILFPYVLGIFCFLKFGEINYQHQLFTLSVCFVIITFLFQKYYTPILYYKKAIYLFCVNAFLFLLAFEAAYFFNHKNERTHYTRFINQSQHQVFAVIDDVPVKTDNYLKLTVKLNAVKSQEQWHYITGKTLVYIKNDTANYNVGDVVLINSKFTTLTEPKNPEEFNYKTYLQQRNIFHILFVTKQQIQKISTSNQALSFAQLGAKLKSGTIRVLRNVGLSQQAFSICSALLVGHDDEIDDEVMKSFSHSGTLHVLSVSGMHTGILYGVLMFLFALFDKNEKHKKLRCFLVIVFLWLFVLITGISPSVLRAALMLSLVLLGQTFYKQGNSYNTLFLSAFILLLYNPYLIKDIGFLLSYFAVLGIMYLYPILNNIYYFENKLLRWAWSLSLMSVAATLFTLPITLVVFHQFPVWFIFSNLIIIPISTALMFAAIALVMFYKIAFIKSLLVLAINKFTDLMLWFAKLTDNVDFGYIDAISFSWQDALFLSILILFGLIIIQTRSYKQVITACIVCCFWITHSIYIYLLQTGVSELLVFHVKNKSVVVLRTGNCVYGNFNELTPNEFDRHIKPYLLTISNVIVKPLSSGQFTCKEKTITTMSNQNTNILNRASDYLIVTKNSNINLLNLNTSKSTPLIIADCSNSYNFVKKLKKQCELNNLSFYSVKENGAFYAKFNQ